LREIKQHVTALGQNVMIYKRSAEDNSATRLRNSDVVLTTYWELANSIPQPPKKLIQDWIKDDKIDLFTELEKWTKANMDEAELLHEVSWYRVSRQFTRMCFFY
jgi:hypothetical protein